MQDVTLVDVHGDGSHLVLQDATGTQFLLIIDDDLRAAVRGDLDRLRELREHTAEPLRPKEIQARIRAGMSAEELASAARMPLEQIRRYEGPVLAEREHVALTARGTALTRTASADVLLEDAVTERLSAREAEPERLWDAWREGSGTWVVQLLFTAGARARAARWRFDPTGLTLEAIDDEARWLSDTPAPSAEDDSPGRERVYDVEADGGVIEVEAAADAAHRSASPTLDLLEALRGRRGQRQPLDDDADRPLAGQTDLVDALLEGDEIPAAHPPASRPEEATDAAILALPKNPPQEQPGRQTTTSQSGPAPTADSTTARSQGPVPGKQGPEPDADTDPESTPVSEPRHRSKGKRPAIPSWDDIVFGSKRD